MSMWRRWNVQRGRANERICGLKAEPVSAEFCSERAVDFSAGEGSYERTKGRTEAFQAALVALEELDLHGRTP